MKRINARTILYIAPEANARAHVISVNTQRRKKVLENLGFTVWLIQHETKFFPLLYTVWKNRLRLCAILIRIDGSSLLDKYTVLKLLLPHIPLIWEIHGFPEERRTIVDNLSAKWFWLKHTIARRLLSYFVDACIFISSELQEYAQKKIYIRKSAVIPNFVPFASQNKNIGSKHVLSRLSENNYHFVLWGGSGELPWQAVDLIQKTAHAIYKQDPHIIFILVSSGYWSDIKPYPNILLLRPVPSEEFRQLISLSHVCLALYHAPTFFPFYFCPMKILEYMAMRKPIIASNIGMIPRMIQDNNSGFLTNNTTGDLCKKILQLTTNQKLSQKFSRNAKTRVMQEFTEIIAEKKYRDLFQSCV